MAEAADLEETLAERLIARSIGATWVLYAIGGLYIAGPVLGWTLTAMAAWRYFATPRLPEPLRPPPVAMLTWVWLIGMAVMLVALIAGHVLQGIGAAATIKSAVGWAKGWALLGLYPFAAAALRVRGEVVYRAVCRLGRQTLILLPLFLAAPLLHLPSQLYVSPLKVFGGSGPEYFAVLLYTIEPGVGTPRWQFFAPWSPAAGMIAVVHMLCAIEEKNLRWRIVGIAASLALVWFSGSRLALVNIAVVWPLAHLVARLGRRWIWWLGTPLVLGAGLFANRIVAAIDTAQARFRGARADSSRVREALGRIAVDRWQTEAPWFGHGVVEKGPHLVEYMPIGSHHSWYGLLFVKGTVGAAALALPMLYSLYATARLALVDKAGRVGFSMVVVLLLYSFGENLEVLGYLFWPALILIGVAARTASDRRSAAMS